MAIKLFETGTWLVQVQRGGIRKSCRGKGGMKEAEKAQEALTSEILTDLEKRKAARVLGFTEVPGTSTVAEKLPPTLREFYLDRWVDHAKVVQNARTRSRNVYAFQYLLYYLGSRRLNELCERSVVNSFVEQMKENGQLAFSKRKDGQPRKLLTTELTNATINRSVQALRALLYFAHAEKVIATPPTINLLPEDDSETIIPPTEEQFQQLLGACEHFKQVAPLMREATEFTAETGLRPGETFALTFKSVDFERGCIRIEMQRRIKMVNGKPWRPKCNKMREVPLSRRARAIVDQRREAGPATPDDLVFPNQGGAPYIRLDYAPKGAGKGFFRDAVKLAGLQGVMTFKHLRHVFAVRLLTRGVPITVVSALLGHSTIQITVDRYGRFASDAKVKWDAVQKLDPEPSTGAPLQQDPGPSQVQ